MEDAPRRSRVYPTVRSFLILLALSALLVACGGGDEAGTGDAAPPGAEAPGPVAVDDETAVRNVVTTYFTSLADGDFGTACAQLSSTAQQQVTEVTEAQFGQSSGNCEEDIAAGFAAYTGEDVENLRNVTITSVEVSGDSATVQVQGARPVTLTKETGPWLIASLT